MTARQLALDFDLRPALGREDFLVAPSNATAVNWLERWPDWPGGGLALWGPEACGKSHLVRVWQGTAGATVVDAAAVTAEAAAGLTARPLAVEDGDRGIDEPALLHVINMLREHGHCLLLTGRTPPARWAVALPDLRSRLAGLAAAAVAPPDDSLMRAVLVKLFADRQLRVGEEIIAYLLDRMDRSFAAARAVVAALDSVALHEHRNVTLALVRDVLQTGRADPATLGRLD